MSDQDDCPEIPPRFIDHLRDQFPLVLPKPDSTERDDLYNAGQQDVLDWIKWLIEGQQER